MQISWLGYSAFRFQSDGTVVIVNPVDAASGFKINKQSADIVITGSDGNEASEALSGSPFVIDGPGEYEVKSVFTYGVSSNGSTLYMIKMDDVSVAYIGPLKLKELTNAELAVLEGADILIVPVGGGSVTGPKEAGTIINQIEPRIVIPSHYKISGSKGLENIDVFLKEYSAPHETMEKLKISKKELLSEDTKIIVLTN
jgi:L-ascorbate metabolism protein UlaG (beta-lactamase superfamily)